MNLASCASLAQAPFGAVVTLSPVIPPSVHEARQAIPGRGSCRGGRRVRRLRCGARAWVARSNSLRSTSFRCVQTGARESDIDARYARRPMRCAPRRPRNRPCRVPPAALSPFAVCPEEQEPVQPARPCWLVRRTPPGFPQRRVRAGRSAPLRRRGAELWGRRACALQYLTRGRLFERSEPKVSEVSSTARPQSEHHSGVGRTRPTAEAKRGDLPGRAFAALTVARESRKTLRSTR
jgi:hypothetical protein